jgi:hypothetical protein
MLILPEALAVAFLESVTVTVTGDAGPLVMVVGVPVIAPVLVLAVSPAGKLPPVIAKVYGPVPPVATKAAL